MHVRSPCGTPVVLAMLLSACGGGGPDGGTAPKPAVPTVEVSVTPAKVTVGQSATITWSAINATSCSASDAWSDAKPVAGTTTVTATAGGRIQYTLACTGPGGTVTQSATLVVPMPVFPSSYENAKKIVLSDPNPGSPKNLNIPNPTNGWIIEGFAFADFFQEGQYSLLVSLAQDPAGEGKPTAPAITYFLRKNAAGQWVDATSTILSNRTGCQTPRKALVADFNGDSKPDVFFACTGHDVSPPPGENPRILLSQPDGTYSNTEIPNLVGFHHGGSAADLNGDGKPDVILTWFSLTPGEMPFVLINKGDGTFTKDITRLPATLQGKSIYHAELIDTDGNGRFNLLLSGHPPDATGFPFPGIAFAPGLLKNDGTGHFLSIPYIPFPNPPSGSTGTRSGAAHDFIFLNGFVYLLQLDYGGAGGMAINRVRLSDLSATTLWEHRGAWPGSTSPCVWPWFFPMANGQIVGLSNLAEKPFDPLRCMAVSISQ